MKIFVHLCTYCQRFVFFRRFPGFCAIYEATQNTYLSPNANNHANEERKFVSRNLTTHDIVVNVYSDYQYVDL